MKWFNRNKQRQAQPQMLDRPPDRPAAAATGPEANPECRACRWSVDIQGNGIGHCRRFPATVSVRASHWCGEFEPE